MHRYWRYETQLLTSDDLRQSGLHPLRCVNLGRCETQAEAEARGRKAGWPGLSRVIQGNVRLACESGRGSRWRLSKKEIAALRSGELLHLQDALGKFTVGWTPRED